MAATFLPPNRVSDTEKTLRGLLLPGQRRLHFTREGDRRRKNLLAAMRSLTVQVAIWQATGFPEMLARTKCVTPVIQGALKCDAESLVLERDESIEASDRRLIFEISQSEDTSKHLSFRHSVAHHEPLLWVSDAVAWSYARGGDWVRRASPLVEDRVVTVP